MLLYKYNHKRHIAHERKDVDRQHIITWYLQKNKSVEEIADLLDVSEDEILKALRDESILGPGD